MEIDRDKIVEAFNKYADSFSDMFGDVSAYASKLDIFTREVPHGGNVYDIACGPGNVSRYLVEKRDDIFLTCVDMSDCMLELCKRNVPSCKAVMADINSLILSAGSIDGAICSFGIPFLSYDQTAAFVSNVSKGLKTGGVFYISCIQGEKAQYEKTGFSGDEEIFFVYYPKLFLDKLFTDNGFDVLDYSEHEYTENEENAVNMIYVLRKTA